MSKVDLDREGQERTVFRFKLTEAGHGRPGQRQQPAAALALGNQVMTNLPFLFALAAVLAAVLASIAIWAPRRLAVKAGRRRLRRPVHARWPMPAAATCSSRPKPVGLEWWLDEADEATVLGSQMREGDSLYLWLQLAGEAEPRAYRLPWNQQMAQQLQQALEEAPAQRHRGPDAPAVRADPGRAASPSSTPPPQPALPPKDLAQPPAQVYEQPGRERLSPPG